MIDEQDFHIIIPDRASSKSLHRTVLVAKGALWLSAEELEPNELRQKLESGVAPEEAAGWARTILEPKLMWLCTDEKTLYVTIKFKVGFIDTGSYLWFDNTAERDRFFAAMEQHFIQFTSSTKQFGAVRAMLPSLLGFFPTIVLGLMFFVMAGRLVDSLAPGVHLRLVVAMYTLADAVGPYGVLAITSLAFLCCCGWAYKLATNPPLMRYLIRRKT